MSKNMNIWDQVKKTDPQYTKQKNERGRSITSISPQYQLQEATKVFGPYGKGFGFASCDIEEKEIMGSWVAVVKAVFFFVQDGERHTFPVNNTWAMQAGKRTDPYLDIDYAKKAETNTMSKALSKLGFSADVFMGQFDDLDYVAHVNNEYAIEKAEDKIEAQAKAEAEHQAKIDGWINTLSNAVSMNDLAKCYKEFVRKANLIQDKVAIGRLENAKDKRKAELEAKA